MEDEDLSKTHSQETEKESGRSLPSPSASSEEEEKTNQIDTIMVNEVANQSRQEEQKKKILEQGSRTEFQERTDERQERYETGGETISPSKNQTSSLHNLEDRRKLEIRLSRLPENVAIGTDERTFGAESSVSPSPSATTSTSEGRSPKGKSVQQRQNTSEGLASRRHILQSRKRATALKRKNTFGPVKIKLNFLTRKLTKTIEGEQKSKKEIDFETKERDAAAAAAEASKRSLEFIDESEFHMEDDPRFSKPSLPSSPDGSSSSSDSENEYDYRPMRAAAAAALKKDSDTLKSIRQKFGNFSPKPAPKAKSRRSIMKRTAQKGIIHQSETDLQFGFHYCRSILHKDTYFQAGDVVTMDGTGDDSDGVANYFGQITNLIRGPCNRHFVEIVWLTPNTKCDRFPFYPQNYDRRDDFPRMTVPIESCDLELRLSEDYFETRRHEDYFRLIPHLPGVVYQRRNRKCALTVSECLDLLESNEEEESVEVKGEPGEDEVKCGEREVKTESKDIGVESSEVKVKLECKETD